MSINLFWDNSNIWLVGQQLCRKIEPGNELEFRIHFKNLFEYAANSRTIDYAFVGGSIPPSSDPLWSYFRKLGINVEKQERGQATGGEVAVDEIIQLQMANRILDEVNPGHLILLTGDGSGYSNGRGFIKQLERAIKHRWTIEVVSWDAGCNRYLKKFAQDNGTYRSLDSVYNKATFINNLRWAT